MSNTAPDEAARGSAAAEELVHRWPDVTGVAEPATVGAAAAAVERLARFMREQPPLFQASRRGSEVGAESLSARPFQGIVESIQNADDLGATELRIAVRRDGQRRQLLVVHDGAPVLLRHVGAMVLPWVSTKVNDPVASGRFGIGQKTLRALGAPIDAHCPPYHFRMDEVPTACAPEPAIADFYDPSARETLLVVHLHDEVDTDSVAPFLTELGAQALVFL